LVCRYAKSRTNTILRKDIAQNKVSVSNGIKLRTLQNRKSQLFLSPLIPKVTASDFVFFKTTQATITQKYSLKKRRENSAERKSFDSSDMMYLLMPDRFANGTTITTVKTIPKKTQQRITGGRHGGDIEGII
jgi:hypothetical protein